MRKTKPGLRVLGKAEREQRLGYLVGALAHSVDELLDDHVHTLDAGLLQLYHLLLHDGFEGHVGGEEAGPDRQESGKQPIYLI